MKYVFWFYLMSWTWLSVFNAMTAAETPKPNFLFIFADDMTYEALGAAGHLDIETPNLDQLASEGAMFSHAYNMGSWTPAVCMASRTSLNTGRFLWSASDSRKLEESKSNGALWSQRLRDAGYKTYLTGKWHVPGVEPENIFDVVKNVRPGMPKESMPTNNPSGYNRPLNKADYEEGWKPWDKSQGGFWQGGTHWSEVIAADAKQFIESASDDPGPFFMYLAFNAPHDPRQSPKEYVDRYPLDRVELPVNFLPEHPHKEAMGSGAGLRDELLAPFPRTSYSVKVNRQEYFAMITHLDVQIGRILEVLEASGEAENTYIFFTADHGLAMGRHGLLGKQNMYEHSMRAPFIAVGPEIEAGIRVEIPIYLQDVMPTTLELATGAVPDEVDFKSLLPIIKGATAQHYDTIYGAYTNRQRMIIAGDYKLIVYPKIGITELYDLSEDPFEMNDISGWPIYEPLVKELKQTLLEEQKRLGDSHLIELDEQSDWR